MSAASGDDPRDASGETKLTFPETWQIDNPDPLSTSVMFASGLVMVTRNRFLGWPSLLMSINSIINQHPLRTKEGGNTVTGTLVLAICSLVASYFPLFMLGPAPVKTQTALPVPPPV